MSTAILLATVLFLAYSNGANDNFKGVATLYGSATAPYRRALAWATVTTFGGSLLAFGYADGLVKAFSGKGLVPDALTATAAFKVAVGLGAATTVFLATRLGFPISTTHALTGALAGAGWMAVGSAVNLGVLGKAFLLPLLVSPLLSLVLTVMIYPVLRAVRLRAGIDRETCACIGTEVIPLRQIAGGAVAGAAVTATVDKSTRCVERYTGSLVGVSAQRTLDVFHYIAAGLVSFARGFNDAPKIAGLLLGIAAFGMGPGVLAVGIAMGIGGLLHAQRVANTMSNDITGMNPGQGFTANAIAGFLVLLASPLGLPVSTTHVTCGALFGIGIITGQANPKVIVQILMAWVTTLPVAATLGALVYAAARMVTSG
jgi:PiT family inorganic phosphate transporter